MMYPTADLTTNCSDQIDRAESLVRVARLATSNLCDHNNIPPGFTDIATVLLEAEAALAQAAAAVEKLARGL